MEKMKDFSKGKFILYCVFCAAGSAVIAPSIKLGLGEKSELGPGFLPFVSGLCLLVTGAVLAVLNLIKKKNGNLLVETEKIEPKGWLRAAGILFNFAVWPLLVGRVGYILTTFLVSLGLAKAIGYQGWRWPIILSLSIAFFIWLIFGFMFQLDLPAGLTL